MAKKHLMFVPTPITWEGNVSRYCAQMILEHPAWEDLKKHTDITRLLEEIEKAANFMIHWSKLDPMDDAAATWICQRVLTTYVRGFYLYQR